MRYLPNTEQERQAMLASLGIQTTEELFKDIPEEVKLKETPDIPHPLSELEVKVHMQKLAQKNRSLNELVSFLGGGFYDHYIPSAVNYIISRVNSYCLYSLPGGNKPGDTPVYLRISDNDCTADRYGYSQRIHV